MRETWEECDVMTQAMILAFDQVVSHDEMEVKKTLAGGGSKPSQAARPARRRRK